MQTNASTKAVVTVAEMARMVGLSRARFYQLMGTAFPYPIYNVSTRRPTYVEEMQEICLQVRQRNCGIDGKPVLFYSRPRQSSNIAKPTRKTKPPTKQFSDIVTGVKSLGMTTATHDQVEQVVKILFPNGLALANHGEAIRSVFVHLMRRDQADNLG